MLHLQMSTILWTYLCIVTVYEVLANKNKLPVYCVLSVWQWKDPYCSVFQLFYWNRTLQSI